MKRICPKGHLFVFQYDEIPVSVVLTAKTPGSVVIFRTQIPKDSLNFICNTLTRLIIDRINWVWITQDNTLTYLLIFSTDEFVAPLCVVWFVETFFWKNFDTINYVATFVQIILLNAKLNPIKQKTKFFPTYTYTYTIGVDQ